MRIYICRSAREGHSRLHSPRGRPHGQIQNKIFDIVIVLESASLPTGGRTAFDNEECDPPAVADRVVQQRPENFFLRGPSVNGRDRLQQIGGAVFLRLRPRRLAQVGLQFFHNPSDQVYA